MAEPKDYYANDHDLLIALNVKLDMVIDNLNTKADKTELTALKSNHDIELGAVKANQEALCARIDRLWYWILGTLGAAVLASCGFVVELLK